MRYLFILGLALASAGLAGAFSLALGTAHVWPGMLVAFGFNLALQSLIIPKEFP